MSGFRLLCWADGWVKSHPNHFPSLFSVFCCFVVGCLALSRWELNLTHYRALTKKRRKHTSAFKQMVPSFPPADRAEYITCPCIIFLSVIFYVWFDGTVCGAVWYLSSLVMGMVEVRYIKNYLHKLWCFIWLNLRKTPWMNITWSYATGKNVFCHNIFKRFQSVNRYRKTKIWREKNENIIVCCHK